MNKKLYEKRMIPAKTYDQIDLQEKVVTPRIINLTLLSIFQKKKVSTKIDVSPFDNLLKIVQPLDIAPPGKEYFYGDAFVVQFA